jgi:hypothetical protein
MTFYVQLLKFASFHLNNSQRKEQFFFKITFRKNCMNILFPTSFQKCLLIVIAFNLDLAHAQVRVFGFLLT